MHWYNFSQNYNCVTGLVKTPYMLSWYNTLSAIVPFLLYILLSTPFNQNMTTTTTELAQIQEMFKTIQGQMNENNAAIQRLESKLVKEMEEIRMENSELKQKILFLEEQNQSREDRDRRDNLVIFGIQRKQRETWDLIEKEIIEFVKKFLGIDLNQRDIVRAHRVGQGHNSPVIIKFSHFKTKEEILQKKHLLKKSSFAIFEDFSLATRQERKFLFQEAARIRSETDGQALCKVSYRTLRVDGVPYELKDGKLIRKERLGRGATRIATGQSESTQPSHNQSNKRQATSLLSQQNGGSHRTRFDHTSTQREKMASDNEVTDDVATHGFWSTDRTSSGSAGQSTSQAVSPTLVVKTTRKD